MKHFLAIISLFAVSFVFTAQTATAQVTIIEEDEVSFEILKWFYNQYPQTEGAIWKMDDLNYYRVGFMNQGIRYSVTYDKRGKRIMERRFMDKKFVPIQVVNYCEDIFSKYKVVNLVKQTHFKPDRIAILVEVKSKEKGVEILQFDESFNLLDDNMITSSL